MSNSKAIADAARALIEHTVLAASLQPRQIGVYGREGHGLIFAEDRNVLAPSRNEDEGGPLTSDDIVDELAQLAGEDLLDSYDEEEDED